MGTVLSSAKYTPDGVPYHRLNDFQELTRLDGGGCGIVYKGYDVTPFTRRRRTVAVKTFNQLDVYAEREIEILKKHSHPHIVELFGVIWDGATKDIDGTTEMPLCSGYVMEYMELGSLHNEIHDVSKHYDMKLIVLWIEQIGSGLQYLHEHKILHRDVKPKNILLATRTHLKLADFGLARYISVRNTNTTGQLGTDSYRAPEIVLSSDYGKAADVFSFGITIWEIIWREHPSEHLQVGNDCIELPIDIEEMSEDSWNFVKRCWQREKSDRPSVEEISAFAATFEQTNRLSMKTVLSFVKYTPDGVPYHRLNDFHGLKRLNGGGYGTVWKGYDVTRITKKKRTVAVKTFYQLDVYAEREIEILIKYPHPHIVELFGVIWDGATKDIDGTKKMPLYSGYVMEYLGLGSLHNEIHDVFKHYDMKLIVLWIQQIGSGLQYLHEHKILHRDVKPKNILLATRTHLKLAGFGLACNISHKNTYTSGRIGSYPYMAPEIVDTEKNYGPSADVYSFGVTIWEIICRKHPSEHSTFGNGCIDIDPDKMSEDSWNFVKRCWQRNIFNRPSIKEIIAFAAKFEQTILVVGGGWYCNKLTIWNRKTSTWTVSRIKLPDRIRVVGAVYLNDELYIIDWDKSFFKLDRNMEWKQLADMNKERDDMKNSGCLGWNGYIWVFGGWNLDRGGKLKSVERYDPKEGKWTRMPDMKYARYDAAAAVCNGKIYICGGRGDDRVKLKSVECFDPESGVWTELTDMPTPRDDHSLVCYRNKLVVIGGYDGERRTTTVLELDPLEKNGQWKELSPLTSPSFPSVGVVLGPEIFTTGRIESRKYSTFNVQIFDGIKWRVGPTLSTIPLDSDFSDTFPTVLVPQEFADRLSSYPVD